MIRTTPDRRYRLLTWVLIAMIGLLGSLSAQQPHSDLAAPTDIYVQDFEAAWTLVRENYAYFSEKSVDWNRVHTHFLPLAQQVHSRDELIDLLEAMLEHLTDPHAHLGVNTAHSPRMIPSGTDLWAEYRDGRPLISAVRAGSAAERAGIQPGWEITAIDGRPAQEAVQARRPNVLPANDPVARDWALRAALAGHHDRPLAIELQVDGTPRTFEFTPGRSQPMATGLGLTKLDHGVVQIRLYDSLGDYALLAEWDAALASVQDSTGLVLDLRDTPGGGNTTVARGIMSRLIRDSLPYQRHELTSEEQRFGVKRFWVEYVAPRGPFCYDRPLVVLVGPWTGSMGEGLAIGLHGMKRGYVIGSPMAGLCGANYSFDLPHSGIALRIPAERLYHVQGTPREKFEPDRMIDAKPGGEDVVLRAACEWLRTQVD